jgi:hypothetical protein
LPTEEEKNQYKKQVDEINDEKLKSSELIKKGLYNEAISMLLWCSEQTIKLENSLRKFEEKEDFIERQCQIYGNISFCYM